MNDFLYEHRKTVTTLLCVLCVAPIMFSLTELWDTCAVALAVQRNDFQVIEHYLEYGWYVPYWAYIFLNKIQILTGIPYKLFLNILMAASVIGLAREVGWYVRHRLGFEREYAQIAFWSAIAFPVWHVLISTAVFINIVCMWFFMLAVRYWYSNKPVSVLFFLLSIQLFSVFPMAIGFIACDFLLTATRTDWVRKSVRGFGLSLAVLVGYVGLTSAISVHGNTGSYNVVTMDNMLKYLPLLVEYCAVIIAIGFAMSFKVADSGEREKLIRVVIGITALLFFAILPYNAVGRPMRYFAFGSFTARHTMLSAIPLAMLLAVVIRYIGRNFSRKIATGVAIFILTAQVVILHQGYSHKAAALVFKDMLTDSFMAGEAPPSGYVAIQAVGYEPPRHVNSSAIDVCLAKAYGRSAWMANGFWRRKRSVEPEWMKKLYQDTMGYPLCVDVTGEAYTKYTFTLTDYHQEGRFWYWYFYLAHQYSSFKPELKKVRELERWDMDS